MMWPIQRVALKSAFFLLLTPVRLTLPISSRLPTSAGRHRATTLERPITAAVRDQANASVVLALQQRNRARSVGCATGASARNSLHRMPFGVRPRFVETVSSILRGIRPRRRCRERQTVPRWPVRGRVDLRVAPIRGSDGGGLGASRSPPAQARSRRQEPKCVAWKAATTQKCYEKAEEYYEETAI